MEPIVSDCVHTEEEINRRHNEKMARRKAARERMLATKTEERGLLIVHTGKGKGKSTAAFGLVLREGGTRIVFSCDRAFRPRP